MPWRLHFSSSPSIQMSGQVPLFCSSSHRMEHENDSTPQFLSDAHLNTVRTCEHAIVSPGLILNIPDASADNRPNKS
jgi:hypothetical protein